MLDAPVSGRPPTMTVMVGGDEAVFARCRPLLAAMAGNIFHVGEAGAGCIAKLVTQYLGYTNFIAALEGMLIGAKAGIDLGVLARIVPLSAGASRTFDNIPRSVLSGTFTAGGTLDIVAKDLHLACDLARAVGHAKLVWEPLGEGPGRECVAGGGTIVGPRGEAEPERAAARLDAQRRQGVRAGDPLGQWVAQGRDDGAA